MQLHSAVPHPAPLPSSEPPISDLSTTVPPLPRHTLRPHTPTSSPASRDKELNVRMNQLNIDNTPHNWNQKLETEMRIDSSTDSPSEFAQTEVPRSLPSRHHKAAECRQMRGFFDISHSKQNLALQTIAYVASGNDSGMDTT